jgi:hypothetical protein
VISGATLRVKSSLIGGKMLSVALPDVHLTHLGTGSDGLTPAELTDKVMNALMNEVIPAFAKLVSNAGLDAVKYGKGAEKLGQDGLNKASGGLKKLFGN